jgi:Concanavalin A-like lectin/glucanases superfamily/Right handed beta helix region
MRALLASIRAAHPRVVQNSPSEVHMKHRLITSLAAPAALGMLIWAFGPLLLSAPALASTSFSSAYRDAVAADSPVAYYRMDEISGSRAGTSGSYQGSPKLGASSLLNSDSADKSVDFDGSNDRITANAVTGMSTWRGISFEAWIEVTRNAPSSEEHIVQFSTSSGGHAPGLFHDNSNKLKWATGSTTDFAIADKVTSLNTVYHVVGTTGENDVSKLYINGVLQNATGVMKERPSSSSQFSVGADYDGSNAVSFWKGRLDEVAVYDYALSQAQVSNHYHAGNGSPSSTTTTNPTTTTMPSSTSTTTTGPTTTTTMPTSTTTTSPTTTTTVPTQSACKGVTVSAGANLAAAVANAGSGTTFCLQSGTYSVGSSSVKPKDNDKLIGVPVHVGSDGSITATSKIVGSGAAIIDLHNVNGVTLQNLDVSGARGTEGCKPLCGRGISQGDNLTVSYTRVHDNMNAGIGGGGAGASLMQVELDHNGSSTFTGCCAGGVKSSDAYTITNSYIHDNIGNGVWQDVCGKNFVVTNNTITNNTKSGVRYEHNQNCSGSATITGNVVKNNNTSGESGAAGVTINSAPGATVAFNVFGGNQKAGVSVGGTRGPTSGTSIHNSTMNKDALKGCDRSGVTCTNNG